MQQQDPARFQRVAAALGNHVGPRLRRVEDPGAPPDAGVAESRDGSGGERAAKAVWCTKHPRQVVSVADGVPNRTLTVANLAGHVFGILEDQDPVVISMAGEFMPFVNHPANQIRVCVHLTSQHEERRLGGTCRQGIQDGPARRAGAIVEGECDSPSGWRSMVDHSAEQWAVSTEGATCRQRADAKHGGTDDRSSASQKDGSCSQSRLNHDGTLHHL